MTLFFGMIESGAQASEVDVQLDQYRWTVTKLLDFGGGWGIGRGAGWLGSEPGFGNTFNTQSLSCLTDHVTPGLSTRRRALIQQFFSSQSWVAASADVGLSFLK